MGSSTSKTKDAWRLCPVPLPILEHEVYELDGSGKEEPIAFGLADKFTNLDAIEVLHDGTFLISDVKGNPVFTVSPDRKIVKKLADLEWAADLGVDPETGLVFVPSLVPNKVVIYQLTGN